MSGRAGLVEKGHPQLSNRAQCELLGVSRSRLDYEAVRDSAEDLKIKRIMDEIFLRDPCLGTRKIVVLLERDHGLIVNRKRVQRLRREMGLLTIYRGPRTSVPNSTHERHPYLLRELDVSAPNQVWCSDITYVPMPHGNAFLCAVMDWHSRKVLGWAVSNTMDVSLCLAALKKALQSGDVPEIFNTDQGSQFTAQEWTEKLKSLGIKISMDGKGRWMDNVFIERLWRSVKHDDIYLREYGTIAELEKGMKRWFQNYNEWRPHDAHSGATPAVIHARNPTPIEPTKEHQKAA